MENYRMIGIIVCSATVYRCALCAVRCAAMGWGVRAQQNIITKYTVLVYTGIQNENENENAINY